MESKFKFLTKYSLSKKLKNKWFIVANIVVALVIICLVNIDQIIGFFGGDFNEGLKINIIDNTGYYETIKTDLEGLKSYLSDTKVEIKKKKDVKEAKEKLKDTKEILLIINEDKDNIFSVEFISDSYVDALKYQSIVTMLHKTKSNIALKNSNIDPNELANISKEVFIKRSFIDEAKTKEEENAKSILSVLSLVIVLPCFMLIVFLVQMIGAEINEEKSTRGMEIIIGNVSAKVHFFSKVVASNLFVLMQGTLLLIYSFIGLVIRKVTNSTSSLTIKDATSSINIGEVIDMIEKSGIVNKLGYLVPLIIILIVLSFLAYSLLAGILASMTTNMENFQQLQTPLMVISVIGYYLILISTAFPGSIFIKIISCLPLISISLTPSLVLSGEISVSILIIGILLLALLNYILIKYGLRIYKVGILNYSEQDLWKKMFKAIKQK